MMRDGEVNRKGTGDEEKESGRKVRRMDDERGGGREMRGLG